MAICLHRSGYGYRQALASGRQAIRYRVVVARSVAQAPSQATVAHYKRDPELQAALDALLADTIAKGRTRLPNSEIREHLDRLEELGRQLGLNRVNPDWNDGLFKGTVTTMMSGVTTDHECSMARLTWGKMQPANLMVKIGVEPAASSGVYKFPDQIKGSEAKVAESPEHGYSTITYFNVLGTELVGKMLVKGAYTVDPEDPSRLLVTFVGFAVEPAFTDEKSLALWLETFAEHNPGMTADGVLDFKLDTPLKSHLRYLVMDPDMHLAIGGSGGFTCMVRMSP